MSAHFRIALRGCAGVALCLGMVSCGGGSDTVGSGSGPVTAANNVASVTVSGGPNNNAVNILYTTVTVCQPGTSDCQTIDNIQVDTGSYGLRLLGSALTLTLPVLTLANGSALLQCTYFVDGYSWGPVALVDVKISGESASKVPVQIIGDSRYPSVPTDCTDLGAEEDTVAQFGANGLLGIGPFPSDCGEFCAGSVTEPIEYYACTTESNCTGTTVPAASQVPNPVPLFAADNNGTIISLPSAPAGGTTTLTGSLIFGIDTQSNNASGSETIVPVDDNGHITSNFGGTSLPDSFIDSGSNAYYFSDSLTPCSEPELTEFYCPSSPTSLSGEMQLASGTSTVDFDVVRADQINAADFVYPGLAGTNPSDTASFDWGLPFFYGRRVATAIDGYATAVGSGPYIAY